MIESCTELGGKDPAYVAPDADAASAAAALVKQPTRTWGELALRLMAPSIMQGNLAVQSSGYMYTSPSMYP